MRQIRGLLLLQKNVTGEDHQNYIIEKNYFSVLLAP